MATPGTAREALIAEMLGDLDSIIERAERLPSILKTAEDKLALTAATLDSASDKYRLAITAFNEQAKAELSEYLDHKTTQAAAKTIEENKMAMQEAAHAAFRSIANDKANELRLALNEASRLIQRAYWTRLIEHAALAIFTSVSTAAAIYLIAPF